MNWTSSNNRIQNKRWRNGKSFLSVLVLLLFTISTFGQSQEVPMADGMRAEGKIYVVVAIVLLILSGLIGYLFFLDKKVSKLENRLPK
jgi:protein-S-isoprenylcysteine O-methyltransferase Ste14